ncbi:efflux RND transporter periplasmic adaptor subunit [Caldalkalibacillus salinus]|uniref:efflux RND transporter periplasmic adaptor subunit n=1 Tax=Caldalkalibacillus salinus TaxID=2803787 RepID=UPI0019243F13|nr:efflux RND transporter periplasmic adaptor subunit [Caldalkalibacillus salinus]
MMYSRRHCLIFIILGLIFIMTGCTTAPLQSADQDEEILPVRVGKVEQGTFQQTIEISGQTRARQTFPVVSPSALEVKDVYVQIGDQVAEGDPLLTFDNQEARAQLQEAKEQVRILEETYQDAQSLSRQASEEASERLKEQEEAVARAQAVVEGAQTGAVTILDLLQASTELMLFQSQMAQGPDTSSFSNITQLELQLEQARTQVRLAEESLKRLTVTAPFPGLVTARYIDPNDMAMPNTPVLQVSNLDQIMIDLQVGSSQINQLRQGMDVMVHLEEEQKAIETSLHTLSPAPGPEGTFQAQIRLDNEDRAIFPGKLARIQAEVASMENKILVPVEAIFIQDESSYVYTIDEEQVAHLQPVDIEERNQHVAVINAGLTPGQAVVTSGKNRLTDGRRVYIQN